MDREFRPTLYVSYLLIPTETDEPRTAHRERTRRAHSEGMDHRPRSAGLSRIETMQDVLAEATSAQRSSCSAYSPPQRSASPASADW